jgi:hypothetical protein
MKHNTHIYIAHKAIEFMRDSVDNLLTMSGKRSRADKGPIKDKAKKLQRLMLAHKDTIIEASWAPDDIINDKARYHTFKLFKDGIFDEEQAEGFRKQTFKKVYHRGGGGGGGPFKIDHLAAVMSDFRKLRSYNDNFSVRELQYLYILVSHYIVDILVPMHCDLRDDPPSAGDKTKPGPRSLYFNSRLHATVESMWERAVTPLAVESGILQPETYKEHRTRTALTDAVEFDLGVAAHRELIQPVHLDNREIMEFMIDRAIASYERSLAIWPPVTGAENYSTKEVTAEMTREIFADAISSVISVWLAVD